MADHDNSSEIILEIQFGEGGKDSKLFVLDLLSAYIKYASRLGLKYEVLDDESDGHATIKIWGSAAGKAFSKETGKHVIQRIPPTEHNGRKQTSVVVVAVLPIPPENTVEQLKDCDLEIITQTGKQKAGGQNVNKTATAVRMKHIPSGISVFINGRELIQNKKEARKILTAKVNELKNSKINSEYGNLRKEKLGNSGRGDKIRTYNWLESRCVDHRTGKKTRNIEGVLKKGMFELLL